MGKEGLRLGARMFADGASYAERTRSRMSRRQMMIPNSDYVVGGSNLSA